MGSKMAAEPKERLLMTNGKKPLRILCVDDEPLTLAVYRRVLEPHGYEVLTTTDSAEAMRILSTEPIDLLIQDLARPGINGFEFYAMLKSDERLRSIPVVICSGHDESRSTFLDRYPEVVAVLEKPFDVAHLAGY